MRNSSKDSCCFHNSLRNLDSNNKAPKKKKKRNYLQVRENQLIDIIIRKAKNSVQEEKLGENLSKERQVLPYFSQKGQQVE